MALCGGLLWLAGSPAWAQGRVPTRLRVAITFKALTYDRNLTKGRGGRLRVGVVAVMDDPAGLKVARELEAELKRVSKSRVSGLALSIKRIELKPGEDAGLAISKAGVNLLYLGPLPTPVRQALEKHAKTARKLLVVSGEAKHARSIAALVVTLVGDKPQIVVNLKRARAQGAHFDARLLRLARVIK